MTVFKGIYKCQHCRHSFEAPILDEFAYGEFLLWSHSGEVALLNVFQDDTYNELREILRLMRGDAQSSFDDEVDLLQKLYGPVVCDPDNGNNYFEMNTFPVCPSCGNRHMESWYATSPPEPASEKVKYVTHLEWSRLSSELKQSKVKKFLSKLT